MCERLETLVEAAHALIDGLDVASASSQQAADLVEDFASLEKLAAAGRTLAAGRASATQAWRASGFSSAAAWLAQRAGTTLTAAAATLDTAAQIEELPEVRKALVSGRLSHVQAAEISAAAAADPASAGDLLALAERESLAALRERCRDVRAAALGDEDATERIRRSRYLHHWMDREGAVRLDARLAPDDAAPLLAVVSSTAERLRAEAHRAGAVEPNGAYAADALVGLASGPDGPRTVVHVHVSSSALERGHTVAGETCRIEGVGPVSVAAAQRLAARSSVKIVETRGVEIARIAHAGRTIPAHLRTALEVRDPTCVVPGCNRRRGLEIDHIVPVADGGVTALHNLARLCRWHHAQKTHHGWRLSGGPGQWVWTPGSRDAPDPSTRGP